MAENRNQWRDTIPDQLKPVGNGETQLDLKKMFTDKKVIFGLIASLIGVLVAFLSFSFCEGHLRMILGFFGTACTFSGTAQITKYINDITVEAAKKKK